MTKRDKPILQALRRERLARPPFWLMRQAGRYLPEYRALRQKAGGFLDLCYAPELAAEVTLQPVRRFGMDAAILFADILLVPQAMGQKLWFAEGEGPRLEPIRTRAAAEALNLDGMIDRLGPVYQAASRVAKALPDQTTLIGFAGAPWTVATYMVEGGSSKTYARVKEWAFGDPVGFGVLIDRLVEATSAHLSAQLEAGAEVVQIFDSWASAVPPEHFERLVIEPTRRIVDSVRAKHADALVIGFPRGVGEAYERYFAETGVDAVSIDSGLSLKFAADKLQPYGAVQGNLDPKMLVAGGEALERAVAPIISALGKGPFIFNLGHGVVPETPVAHVAQLADILRR